MEKIDPKMPRGQSRNFRAFMMSAPVNSDLLKASNWTVSNSLLLNDYVRGLGWLEGNAVITPADRPAIMLRVGYRKEQAAIIDISSDGTKASFNPQRGFVDFPGGMSKFVIRYDEKTRRYWSLVNCRRNPSVVRNVLALSYSRDLRSWHIKATILSHPDSKNVAFQYVDWQFEGNDIIFVSRTAYNGAANFHDANYFTFHRIKNFRFIGDNKKNDKNKGKTLALGSGRR